MIRNSKIILAKGIKLDREYKNVINYTETEMLQLLNSQEHFVLAQNDLSFIRKRNNNININADYNLCLNSNYIAFQNPDYSNKWFFAWIDNVIYISDNNVEIEYTIDSFSTWFSKINIADCYVNREHVSDDSIGLHTVPENLDVGEVIEESQETESFGTEYYFCITTNYDPFLDKDYEGVRNINKNLVGSLIFLFNPVVMTNIEYFIAQTNFKGKIESIQNLFVVPAIIADNLKKQEVEGKYNIATYRAYRVDNNPDEIFTVSNITVNKSFGGYIPKNNKCYCYPYNYLMVSNNVGNQIIYKYEDFTPRKFRSSII